MKNREIDYWNSLWQGPDLGVQWKHRAAAALVEHQPVLDIGCGAGHFLDALRQRGLEKLVGCDLALSSAKALSARGLPALCCDAERSLPFPDRHFAAVALIDVLEHTFEPERVLAEAARVAREIVLVVPNFNSVTARYQVLGGGVPENNTPRKRHAYWFNYAGLKKLIASLGLELVSERFHTFKYQSPLLGPPFRLLGRLRPQLFSLAFALRVRVPARGSAD